MSMDRCGFVTIGNADFFDGVYALAVSVCVNSPAPICVLDQGLTPNQVGELGRIGVSVVQVERAIPIDHPRFGCCYALFDIGQAPFDQIIYLDADTLVLEDIRGLFSRIKDDSILCSVANPAARLVTRDSSVSVSTIFEELGLPWRSWIGRDPARAYRLWRYRRLNSGVLGITKRALRKLKPGIARYASILDRLPFPDQDLLSLLAVDYRLCLDALDYVDNATRLHLHPEHAMEKRKWQRRNCERVLVDCRDGKVTILDNRYPKGIQLSNARIRVLHYNSPDKPWREGAVLRDGFKETWQYYREYSMDPSEARARLQSCAG